LRGITKHQSPSERVKGAEMKCLSAKMTPAQIAEAQKMAQEWVPKK
jgi:hypothetical protein